MPGDLVPFRLDSPTCKKAQLNYQGLDFGHDLPVDTVIKVQLEKAGVRLAWLLNETLK
jgi:hypothetical protein